MRKLQKHFNQANEDVRQILISADKIEAHGERIEQVEFSERTGRATRCGQRQQSCGKCSPARSRGVIFSGRF